MAEKEFRSRARPADRRYHHGDLREALLAAAERVIDRDGLPAFTLRACAREAGVSHAAPAHHFGDLGGLTAEVAIRAFDRLSGLMDRYARESGPDPRVVLPAMGVAYIDFALRHPGLYRLMFGLGALEAEDARVREAAEACHGRLSRAVHAALEADGRIAAPARVRDASALAWSVVHGFASLALDGHFAQGRPADAASPDLLDYAGRVLMQLQPVFQSPE